MARREAQCQGGRICGNAEQRQAGSGMAGGVAPSTSSLMSHLSHVSGDAQHGTVASDVELTHDERHG